MDFHRRALQDLCRLCGKRGSKRFFPKEKLTGVIFRSLSLDILTDDNDVFPPSVCILCERKLYRWNVKKNKNMAGKVDIFISDFQPHNQACMICSKASSDVNVEHHAEMFRSISAACPTTLVTTQKGEKLFIVALDHEGNTEKCMIVSHSGEWQVKIYGRTVSREKVFPETPEVLLATGESTKQLINKFLSLNICPGNPDFFIPSTILKDKPVYTHHSSDSVTIRHTSCPLLTPENTRCAACRIYRSTLSKLHHRLQIDLSPAPKTNYRFISKERLSKKLSKSRAMEQGLKKRVSALEEKIEKLFEKRSMAIPQEDSAAFSAVLSTETETVYKHFPENSPMRLLWDQQIKRNDEHPQAMRWHPSIIRLCIALQAKSPSAYELLRTSGFLNLPHKRTLKHYTNFTDNLPGFNRDIIHRVMMDIDVKNLKPHQKSVALSFDEMKVNEGLVYAHSTGQIIGFTSLGSLNDELTQYAKGCTSESTSVMASHVLALMIRGICANFHAPIAYFASSGASSDQLYPIILEGVELMELQGLHVRAIVCDGASSNRTFYSILSGSRDGNKFTHPTTRKEIYLFSDVPHLVKTCRNNFENSGFHTKTRNLMFRGCSISWKHIVDVYEWDLQNSTGLRMLPRITDDHIHLTPAHRMKVKLAAQILSSTVANALRMQGRTDTQSTCLFIEYMDTFFDCLNVSRFTTATRKKKDTLQPYSDISDWRFTWLEEDFLSFLLEWETEGQQMNSLSAAEKEKLCLSRQTLDGLRMSVRSFVSLAKEMLGEPGVKYILSEKFTQDPLEEYFSKQRGVGGRFDNPNVRQFGSNMQTLQVAGACIRASKRANVSAAGTSGLDVQDKPIPRKKLFKKR